jgi:hypothetical protein
MFVNQTLSNTPILLKSFNKVVLKICHCFSIYILHRREAPSNHCLKKWAMTQKSWKTVGYIIDFKNGSRCGFSEKGAVSNFFSRKGGDRPKKVGNLWSRQCGSLDVSRRYGPELISKTMNPE